MEYFPSGYALLIGVGQTEYQPWSLPVTVRDIHSLNAILTNPELCGYKQQHIRLLHDSSATQKNIISALSWLEKQATHDSNATIIVYYSGHGYLDTTTGGYYLIQHDTVPSNILDSALSGIIFANALHRIPAQRLLVIMDCCHAEGMATAKNQKSTMVDLSPRFEATSISKDFVTALRQGTGRAVFTSSLKHQRSWVRPDRKMSIYTYHLVEALRGVANKQGESTVRLSHLMNYLAQTVPFSAKELCGAEQVPFFDTATEDFPIALVRGGQGLSPKYWNAQVFYETIRSSPLSSLVTIFEPVIKEYTRDFVGRRFIFDEIEKIINHPDHHSGYITITGDPGIGKSALMAQLFKNHGYVHHFNIALQGLNTTKDFLTNICAQLSIRYNLGYNQLGQDEINDIKVFNNLLFQATKKSKNLPIILLIDALDEVDIRNSQRGNPLLLPDKLPDNVFIITTTRKDRNYHFIVEYEYPIYIKDIDDRNLNDIHTYIMNKIIYNRDKIEQRIREWATDEHEFCAILTEKSQGNFRYIVHILRDILEGRITAANIDSIHSLPAGLRNYYRYYWNWMKAYFSNDFKSYYEPVVCYLATSKEPVSAAKLSQWTKLGRMQVMDVLRAWSAFINEQPGTVPNESIYRFFHKSFQDFLVEEIGIEAQNDGLIDEEINRMPPRRRR